MLGMLLSVSRYANEQDTEYADGTAPTDLIDPIPEPVVAS
jgi:hypothetical protein